MQVATTTFSFNSIVTFESDTYSDDQFFINSVAITELGLNSVESKHFYIKSVTTTEFIWNAVATNKCQNWYIHYFTFGNKLNLNWNSKCKDQQWIY